MFPLLVSSTCVSFLTTEQTRWGDRSGEKNEARSILSPGASIVATSTLWWNLHNHYIIRIIITFFNTYLQMQSSQTLWHLTRVERFHQTSPVSEVVHTRNMRQTTSIHQRVVWARFYSSAVSLSSTRKATCVTSLMSPHTSFLGAY